MGVGSKNGTRSRDPTKIWAIVLGVADADQYVCTARRRNDAIGPYLRLRKTRQSPPQGGVVHKIQDQFKQMNDDQLLRYSRHIMLDDIGIEGQERLLAAHALIIGAGGLGSPASLILAAAGVGTITLVDDDQVDLTNLQRQIAHTTERVGMDKVESARIAMLAINPGIDVRTVKQRVDTAALEQLAAAATVVLDCTDNYQTRHAINAACVRTRKPLVAGAAIRMDGQISVFDPRREDSPCYACLFSPDDEFEEVQCSTMGVFSPMVSIIGSMQAAEALKLIVETAGPSLCGRLLMLDGRSMQWTEMRAARDPQCTVCGHPKE